MKDKSYEKKLSGLVACLGESEEYIVGKAHVILDFSKIDEFEDNAILVTEQTNPECTVAMEKALAVLTERGGVLCHAAIVCRDLNKPCIVGIRNLINEVSSGQEIKISIKTGDVFINNKN